MPCFSLLCFVSSSLVLKLAPHFLHMNFSDRKFTSKISEANTVRGLFIWSVYIVLTCLTFCLLFYSGGLFMVDGLFVDRKSQRFHKYELTYYLPWSIRCQFKVNCIYGESERKAFQKRQVSTLFTTRIG
jgi:hypothetical protein